MEIQHRKYLLSFHDQSFYGFWKALLDSPPCKPPNSPRNKDFSYELEAIHEEKHELYLHLIGDPQDLDIVERQLSKYKIARMEPSDLLVLIVDGIPDRGAMYMFREFCVAKGYRIKGKEIYRSKEEPVLKTYR